mgnify:CR=1 FL=1
MSLSYKLLGTDGNARRGQITTAHGTIETPAFMPVGTQGAILRLFRLARIIMLAKLVRDRRCRRKRDRSNIGDICVVRLCRTRCAPRGVPPVLKQVLGRKEPDLFEGASCGTGGPTGPSRSEGPEGRGEDTSLRFVTEPCLRGCTISR